MSITKRSDAPDKKPNKWRIRVSRNGKKYDLQFYGTKKEAEEAERDLIYRIDRGLVGTDERILFSELYDLVLEQYVKVKCKNNTLRVYQNAYKNHLEKNFGHIPLNQIKPLGIQMFINNLANSYSPYMVKTTASVLHNCLNFAVKWDILTHSPYKNIELPRRSSKNYDELMSMDDINTLFELYENEPNLMQKTAFYLAIGCGLRNSEVRALTLNDIDFSTSTLMVNKQAGLYDDEKGKSISTKTDGSERKIYMPDIVASVLKAYIASLKTTPLSGQIFYSFTLNAPIDTHTLSKYFRQVLIDNNLPIIRFHDLRHLHATLLINEGVNIKSVSSRLGHAKVETTLQFYTHKIDEYDKKAAQQLNSILSPQKKSSIEATL